MKVHKLNNLLLAIQFKFLSILPLHLQHAIVSGIVVYGHNGVANGKQGAKMASHINHSLDAIHNTATHFISDVTSSLLTGVAHLLGALFWSTKIGYWLAKNSPASTVFCVDKSDPNSTKHLIDIINKNPLELIFPASHLSFMTTAINNIQSIFITIMIAILIIAVMVAGMKLTSSSILNGTEQRQQFLNMSFRIGIVFLVLSFLPDIIGIALKINGIFVLSIQQAMMNYTPSFHHVDKALGGYLSSTVFKNQKPNMWLIAYTVGADSGSLSTIINSVHGFLFNLAYVLVNIGTAIWVKFFYIWREVSFVILLLLGFIQIPMFAFNSTRNHFLKWCKSMFSVIFIQSINALVIYIMTVLWLFGLQQLGDSNTSLVNSFGTMIFLLIVLTMFQPLTKVIASHLDIDTGMIDVLTQNSSSTLRVAGGVAGGIALGSLVTGKGLIKGGQQIGQGLSQVLGGGADAIKAKAKLNNAKNNNDLGMRSLVAQHQLNNARKNMKNGLKNAKNGAVDTLKGMVGGLATAFPLQNIDALMKQGGAGGGSASALRPLANTLAGGVVGRPVANKLQQARNNLKNLGLRTLDDNKLQQAKRGKNNQTSWQAKVTGKNDNGKKANLAHDLNAKATEIATANALANASDETTTNETGALATHSNAPLSAFRKYAQHVAKQAKQNNFQAKPFINGTSVTQGAFNNFKNHLNSVANGKPLNANQARQAFTNFTNSPNAITGAMNDALNNSGISNDMLTNDPNVNTKQVLGTFEHNLRDLGYSANQAHLMANGFIAPNSNNAHAVNNHANAVNNNLKYRNNNGNAINSDNLQGYNAFGSPTLDNISNNQPNNANANHFADFASTTSSPITTNQKMTPSYLNNNLLRDDNGNIDSNAVQAHIANGVSYLTGKMQDGTTQIISPLNQGDTSFDNGQEFCQPLTYRNGHLQGTDALGQSSTGFLIDKHGNKKPYRINSPYVSQLVNDFNGGHAFQNYNTIAPALNNLVDKGDYTLSHVQQNANLSNFALNANNATSYITAYDRNKGERVRISEAMSGIPQLSAETDVTLPLNLDKNGFNTLQNMKMTTQSQANVTQNDFNIAHDWAEKVNANHYLRKVAFNENNYLKNHQGNYNINMVDFKTDE